MIGADVKVPGTVDVDEGKGKPGKTCADAMDPAASTPTTANSAARRPKADMTRGYQLKTRTPTAKTAVFYSNLADVEVSTCLHPVAYPRASSAASFASAFSAAMRLGCVRPRKRAVAAM